MSEEAQPQEVSVETAIGKFKARGSDILVTVFGTIVVAGLTLLGYILWEHKDDGRQNSVHLVTAIKEMTVAQTEGVKAQRVMNCLLATPQDRREAAILTCERIAR